MEGQRAQRSTCPHLPGAEIPSASLKHPVFMFVPGIKLRFLYLEQALYLLNYLSSPSAFLLELRLG